MKRQPVLVAVIGYIIGILWGLCFKFSIIPFYFLMTAIYIFFRLFIKKEHNKKFKLLSIKRYSRYLKLIIDKKVFLVIIIFSIISNLVIIKENQKYENTYKENEIIEITGIINGDKQEKQFYDLYQIKVINSKHYNLYIQVNKKCKEFEYGDKVKLKGKFKKPKKARNYGGYDDSQFLKTIKVEGRVKVKQIKLLGKRQANIIMQYANDARCMIKEQIEKNFEKEKSAILKGLVLGETDDIKDEVKENFQISNISHILAISGMHINYIIIFIKILFEKIVGKRKTRAITIICLLAYIFITGFSPSIVRAVVMGSIALSEILVYRKSNSINSISIALLSILIYNPFLIINIGLQLSFFCTIGIVLLKPFISQELDGKFRTIKEIIAVSVSAQIMGMPIILYHFNKLGIYFLITNLLVNIIIGPVFIFGVISIFVPFIFSKIASFGLYLLDFISKISYLPFEKIYVPTPNLLIIFFYFIFIFLTKNIFIIYKSKTLNSTQKRIKNLIQLAKYKFRYRKKERKSKIILIIILFIINIFVISPKTMKIFFVDVGQGDCTFIVTPHNKTILIDGGGSENNKVDVGKSTLIPYLLDRGYAKIDYIIISHFDQDHVGRAFNSFEGITNRASNN